MLTDKGCVLIDQVADNFVHVVGINLRLREETLSLLTCIISFPVFLQRARQSSMAEVTQTSLEQLDTVCMCVCVCTQVEPAQAVKMVTDIILERGCFT